MKRPDPVQRFIRWPLRGGRKRPPSDAYTKSVLLDGVDDQFTGAVAFSKPCTLEAWIKLPADIDTGKDFRLQIGGGGWDWELLGAYSDGWAIQASCYDDEGTGGGSTHAGVIVPGTWTHVAVTVSGDLAEMYTAGAVGTLAGSGGESTISTPPTLALGGPPPDPLFQQSAVSLARLAIHASALSPETIAAHAADPQATWGSPEHEWIFGNDPADSTEPDGLIHDQVGTAHLAPSGTVAGSIVDDYPVAP